jgi:hypothetical protein
MGQVALPNSDISDSGWTPQTVYQQINETVPNDQSYVISAGSPGGDTFQVGLQGLAWPDAGTIQLTIRLCKTDTGNLPVTVTLLQGSTTIATRVLSPTNTSFENTVIVLTAAEAAAISDYTKLRVQVSTTPPGITRRALGTQGDGSSGSTLTLSSVTVMAGELLVVSVGASDVAVSGVTFNGSALQSAVTARNAGNCQGSIWYLAIGADTTGDITVTWSSGATGRCLLATAVAALASKLLDETAHNAGSGTAPSSGSSAVTTAADEYLHGSIFTVGPASGTYLVTWQNGFSRGQIEGVELQGQLVGMTLQEGYDIVSATGSYTAAGTTPSSSSWVALLATFK